MESSEHDFVLVNEDDTSSSDQSGLQPLSAKKQLKIREWLQPTDYSANSSEYHRHLSSHVPGTTEWTEKAQYQRWISSKDEGALWVKAIAGAGKSVAAAYVAYGLQKTQSLPDLYFFFRQIIESNRTPASLLRDWMSQLLEFSPFLQWQLNEYLDLVRSLDSVAFDELWQHFENAVSSLQRVYCFADALDEMSSGNDWFIERLAKLGQLKPANVKVLMTSRPLPHIGRLSRHESVKKIALGKSLVDEDIVIYIQHRLRNSQLSQDVWQPAQDGLLSRSQGSFLYTKLTMDDLLDSKKHNLSDAVAVHKTLDDMPNGLAEKYTNMLHDHSARSGVPQSLQLVILRWVTHSNRPLRLLEIAAMIDSLSGKYELRSGSQVGQPRRNTKSVVREACGPLIEILEDETMGVIHHSCTEFLIDASRTPAVNSALLFPSLDSRETHLHMALTCVNYFNSGWSDDVSLLRGDGRGSWHWTREADRKLSYAHYPFLKYACLYRTYHTSQYGDSNDELFQALDNFLLRSPKTFALYVGSQYEVYEHATAPILYGASALHGTASKGVEYAVSETETDDETDAQDLRRTSALHIAAGEGLAHYVEHLICSGQDIEAKNRISSTPLHCAASSGSDSVVNVLLNHGANPDADDDHGLKPLHIAASKNNASTVKVLLDAGVNPSTPKSREHLGRRYGGAPSTQGDTPVKYAFTYGHLDAALVFLPFLDPDAVTEALNWAVEGNKIDIILAVLDLVKVDVNKVTNDKTLLHLAAYRHAPRLIRRLLDLGADNSILSNNVFGHTKFITDHRECSATPLHAFATGKSSTKDDQKSTTDALRLLLASGCNIEAVDAGGRTPLHLAVDHPGRRFGYAVEDPLAAFSLLENGANPSAITNKLIHALCERGADVNAINPQDGKTALHYAVTDDWSLARILALIECGADCNIQDNFGDTPLHLALKSTRYAKLFTKPLLEHGAEPNIKNKAAKTPLHNLGSNYGIIGDELKGLLAILLSKGVDLESRMPCGRTFFMEFLTSQLSGTRTVLSILREAGCKQDVHDYQGGNVLHLFLAKESGSVSIFRALMDLKDLDPFEPDRFGNTLLHVYAQSTSGPCAHQKNQNIFKLLLELGLVVDQQNYFGQTVFFAAAMVAQNHEIGYLGIFEFFSNAQCSSIINTADHHGIHSIHLSAIIGEHRTRWMVDRGADVFALTKNRQSALHLAARARNSNVVGFLAELYASRKRLDFINHTDQHGRTALHYACRSGRIESVQILLDTGANINALDRYSQSPLDICAEFSKENFLGTNDDLHIDTADVVRAHDYHAQTPIVNWECHGHSFSDDDSVGIRYVIRYLVARGADISHTIFKGRNGSRYAQYFGDVYLDRHKGAGSTILLEELLPEIEKAEQAFKTDSSGERPRRDHTSPYVRYLENYRSVKDKFSGEMLDELIEPDKLSETNSRVFQTLLRHEDASGVERFLAYKTLSSRHEFRQESSVSTLVKHGYADILRNIDFFSSNIAFPPQAASEEGENQDAKFANQLLLHACERKLPNLEVLKILVESGKLDINYDGGVEGRHFEGGTALHRLAGSQHWWHLKAIEYLVKKGADIDRQGFIGMTPLHVAVRQSLERNVQVLLQNGANPNVVADDGLSCLTCLNLLDRSRDSRIAHILLDYGADPGLGKNPFLFDAIQAMDIGLVTRLARMHADSSCSYELSATKHSRSLYLAGNGTHNTKNLRPKMTPIVEALLRAGGLPSTLHDICESGGTIEPFLNFPGIDIEDRDSEGRTLFIAACSHRSHCNDDDRGDNQDHRPTIAQELAAHGANVLALDNNNQNGLHHLLHDCRSRINPPARYILRNLNFLLSHPSSPELVSQRDSSGMTPLHYAAWAAAFNLLEPLLAKGSDPYTTDNAGNSLLHFAVPHIWLETNFQIFAHLLSLNLPLNALNHHGESPLFLYLQTHNANRNRLPFFADHGADFFTRDKQGQGLLHAVAATKYCACEMNRVGVIDQRKELFEWVLAKGVDVGWEDEGQRTALDVAAGAGNEGILGLFRRKE